jgi:hypothetical protein
MKARAESIYAFTPATDFGGGDPTTSKKGYGVTVASDTATLSASASVHIDGVILDPEGTDGKASIGILGSGLPPVYVRLGGTVTKGGKLQQKSDGTFEADAGTGARVVCGRALESGVSGELIEAVLHNPISLS